VNPSSEISTSDIGKTYQSKQFACLFVLNATNPGSSLNKEGIALMYHFIREHQVQSVISIRQIDTKDYYADPFNEANFAGSFATFSAIKLHSNSETSWSEGSINRLICTAVRSSRRTNVRASRRTNIGSIVRTYLIGTLFPSEPYNGNTISLPRTSYLPVTGCRGK
jgi:hypothetical protein